MLTKLPIGTVVVTSALFLGLPAIAAESPSRTGTPDPEEKICEKITLIGSRVATKRVCATRREWEEKRRQDQAWVDKAQREVCVVGVSGLGVCSVN